MGRVRPRAAGASASPGRHTPAGIGGRPSFPGRQSGLVSGPARRPAAASSRPVRAMAPSFDHTAQRLFVAADLAPGGRIEADRAQVNYLLSVLRLGSGDRVLLFNGRDGEWVAEVETVGRRDAVLVPVAQTRPQTPVPDLLYLFAPLKHARLDYMVQKAVEMGAGVLAPVITRRTQATRVNLERMEANVLEACEQCGVLAVPSVRPPRPLAALVADFATAEPGRTLIFCDEDREGEGPIPPLSALTPGPLALLIGPEGGFDPEERALLARQPFVRTIGLGPRILRADTAAVAALAVVQSVLGDWRV